VRVAVRSGTRTQQTHGIPTDLETGYQWRLQVTRPGKRVGIIDTEYHGRAVWHIGDLAFVDPGEPPRTIEP
jgi:hypothetical protein